MQRVLLVLMLLPPAAAAQEIVGTYRGNDLAGLEAASAKDPANLGLRLRVAQGLIRAGREASHPDVRGGFLKRAEAIFTEVLEKDPKAQVPLRILALDAYATRDFERTVAYGQRVLEQIPGDLPVARHVLKALVRLRREDEAVAFFVDWLARGTVPSLGALQGTMSTLVLTSSFREKLEAALDAAIASRPSDVQLKLYKVIFLAEIGRTEGAWRLLQEAEAGGLCDVRTGERHPMVRSLKSKGAEQGETAASYDGMQLPEVEAALAQAEGHVGMRLRRALLLEQSGRPAEALAALDRVLEGNPDLWPALYRKGELLIAAGRPDEAVEPLARARALYPDLIPGRILELEARFAAGRYDGVDEILLPIAGVIEPVARVEKTLREAHAKAPAEFMAKVHAPLEAALQASPGNPYLAAHLALASLIAGETAAARTLALRAEQLGLVGPEGYPNRLLYEAFAEPLPKDYPALTPPPRDEDR